jgi:hypothetical protein
VEEQLSEKIGKLTALEITLKQSKNYSVIQAEERKKFETEQNILTKRFEESELLKGTLINKIQ